MIKLELFMQKLFSKAFTFYLILIVLFKHILSSYRSLKSKKGFLLY